MDQMTPLQHVAQLLSTAMTAVYSDIEVEPEVARTDAQFGDFQTNIALKQSKSLQKAPNEIAKPLVAELEKAEDVSRVQVAGPGFINITLNDAYWRDYLISMNEQFGRTAAGKGKKVQVEFISANPTGPLTLGNARGAFIGDVLSNLLETQGYEVVREYYFNDAGTQISKLLESVKTEAGLMEAEDRQYRGEYITRLAQEFKNELKTKEDQELKRLITQEIFQRYIRPDIAAMGIDFDVWFNETSLLEDGTFTDVTELLKQKDLLFERDGAQWVNTGVGGDPREERVFIKSNGDPAYFAPDVAYHVNIFGRRGFDTAIKELGPDHIAQFPSVQAVIKVLFPEKDLQMVGHQQVRLIRDGKEVKMSKRLGQVVTVGELIDEVGADVARFFFLMRSNDTHMDFDLDLAAEQSQKNPFWYVMYAWVRSQSILRQAGEQGVYPAEAPGSLEGQELLIAKKLSHFPELLEEMAQDYSVHRLSFYGQELAKLFHEWYEKVRVLDLPPQEAAEKLYFLEQFHKGLASYFTVLGITPRDRM